MTDKGIISKSEPIHQICFDNNGSWVDVPFEEYEAESVYEKRILFTTPQPSIPEDYALVPKRRGLENSK